MGYYRMILVFSFFFSHFDLVNPSVVHLAFFKMFHEEFKGDCNSIEFITEVWKSSDGEPCHLVRFHSDVPDAALSIVVATGVVKAGEGARLSRQLQRTTTP